jgi:nicotinamide riboside kinase
MEKGLRLAVSGASSTGKTTLIRALGESGVLKAYRLRVLAIDERAILRQMGCEDTGCMATDALRSFQLRLLEEKITQEQGQTRFISELSFVAMAAYWTVRDCKRKEAADEMMVNRCRRFAAEYDLHIVLPFGAIPFEADGYRSRDMNLHQQVAAQIDKFLKEWRLRHIILAERDLAKRVEEVRFLLRLCLNHGTLAIGNASEGLTDATG